MGALSQHLGAEFEKSLETSLDAYRKAGVASLDFMPIPTYQTGQIHPATKQPLLAPSGKPPFDAYGYWHTDATMIGAELKSTMNMEVSLQIISPGKKGSGLQYHQLDALAKLATHNGIARLVWNNGGMVGVLYGSKIIEAWIKMNEAIKTELRPGMKAPLGSKSIKWEEFRQIKMEVVAGFPIYDWLMLDSIV